MLRLQLRTEGSALHPLQNQIIATTADDRDLFREPRHVVVLVGCAPASSGSPPPGCLATPAGFRTLRRLHDELESLSGVRRDGVESLASLLRVSRSAGKLSLERALDQIPDAGERFESLLAELREKALTNGLLLSEDGRFASFYVPLAENRPLPELLDVLEDWRRGVLAESPGYELALTGPELAEATLGRMVLRDLAVLVPAMLVVICILLYLTFGNLGGVLIPMAEAGVVLVWTFGAMGWLGAPVTLVTTILPVVLMAIAITDEIHLLERLGAQPAGLERGEALLRALDEVGRPIVMTSVTTALGFLSFLSASIDPIRAFGLFTALGITAAMLLTFAWIPALIVSLPADWMRERRGPGLPGLGLSALATGSVRHPRAALATGLALVAISAPGLFRLEVQDSWIDNFSPDSALVKAERDFNDSFWGSYHFDVVFEAEPDFFYSSAGARLLEQFEESARQAPAVGGIESPLTPLREIAHGLGEELPLSGLPAMSVADLATVLEMTRGGTSLRRLMTEPGDASRARLYVNSADYAVGVALRDDLDRRLAALPRPGFVEVHTSGDLPVATELVGEIVANQLRSIAWAMCLVAGVLVVFFTRSLAGLIAMVPVCAAITCLFGGMGLLGVPLGIATSMFASLTVGVGVDFGIHFLHRYRRERSAGSNDAEALEATVAGAGEALRWNALVLALGFLVLTLSSLKPNHSLGFLLAAAMLACYVATLLFLPRLARIAASLLLGSMLVGLPTAPAVAGQAACSAKPDPAAREIMAGLERDVRSRPLVSHMKIQTHYRKGHRLAEYTEKHATAKTIWGVFAGNAQETWTLYVFSGPGRLAGTTLLLRDRSEGLEGDPMWLYLRAFETFSQLESTERRRALVPGTALTYEDARGFIPRDKYDFSFLHSAEHPDADDTSSRGILACPKTQELSRDLGYGLLEIRVDPARGIVLEIDYRDLAGEPSKHYRLEEAQQVGERWFPRRVVLEQLAKGSLSPIEYEYWLPEQPPPRALFQPDVSKEVFLPRLERYLRTLGLQQRIGPELDAARRSVEAWARRWGVEVEPLERADPRTPTGQHDSP
jgi:predicted RND superfamily exporter protein